MTNEQIIQQAAVTSGLFTQETVDTFAAEGVRLPLHTYQEWRRLGYQVKQGEEAVLVVNLWRFSKVAVDTEDSAREQEAENATGERAYMAKAHLFLGSQVEKIQGTPKKDLAAYNAMLAAQRAENKAAKQNAAGAISKNAAKADDLKAKVAAAKAAAHKAGKLTASKPLPEKLSKATSRKAEKKQTPVVIAQTCHKTLEGAVLNRSAIVANVPAVSDEPVQLDFSAVAASILA